MGKYFLDDNCPGVLACAGANHFIHDGTKKGVLTGGHANDGNKYEGYTSYHRQRLEREHGYQQILCYRCDAERTLKTGLGEAEPGTSGFRPTTKDKHKIVKAK